MVANAGIMESAPVLDVSDVDENGDLREESEGGRVLGVNVKWMLNSRCYLGTVSISSRLSDLSIWIQLDTNGWKKLSVWPSSTSNTNLQLQTHPRLNPLSY